MKRYAILLALALSLLMVQAANADVINGGFESGGFAPGWSSGYDYGFTYHSFYSMTGTPGTEVVTTAAAYAGTYGAQLGSPVNGGEPSGFEWMSQDLKVTSPSAQVTFQRYVSGYDWSWDGFDVVVRDLANVDLARTNLSGATSGWINTAIDLSAFNGQTIRLVFGISEDGAGDRVGVYIDNVQGSGVSPVPIPGTLVLLGSGLLPLLGWRRLRQG